MDILRIAATILIIFHHYQQTTGAFFEGHVNYYNGRMYFGYIVEFFFLLSGYLMYRYVQKIQNGLSFREYYVPKFLRFAPMVLISGITYEMLLWYYTTICGKDWCGLSVTIWGIVINALGVQDGWCFSNPHVNNPTWYISVLLLCYLVLYVIVYLARRWKIRYEYLFVFMVLLGCGVRTYGIDLPFINSDTARGFYAFFFGILIAEAMEKAPKKDDIYIYIQHNFNCISDVGYGL